MKIDVNGRSISTPFFFKKIPVADLGKFSVWILHHNRQKQLNELWWITKHPQNVVLKGFKRDKLPKYAVMYDLVGLKK